mgnify:CR=1 FL=1
MKLKYKIFAIIVFFTFTACDDFLEPNSKSEFVPKDAGKGSPVFHMYVPCGLLLLEIDLHLCGISFESQDFSAHFRHHCLLVE